MTVMQWIALIMVALGAVSIVIILISAVRKKVLIWPATFLFVLSLSGILFLFLTQPSLVPPTGNSETASSEQQTESSTNESDSEESNQENSNNNTDDTGSEKTEKPKEETENGNDTQNSEEDSTNNSQEEETSTSKYDLDENSMEYERVENMGLEESKEVYTKTLMAHAKVVNEQIATIEENAESSGNFEALATEYDELATIIKDHENLENPAEEDEYYAILEETYGDAMDTMANFSQSAAKYYEQLAVTREIDYQEAENIQGLANLVRQRFDEYDLVLLEIYPVEEIKSTSMAMVRYNFPGISSQDEIDPNTDNESYGT